MDTKQKAIIVIPTYNEAQNLPHLVSAILDQKAGVDILIVDDSSPDGTGPLADKLALQIPELKVLHRKVKNGLGRAYIEGFNWALKNGYEILFQMDADLSHDPSVLPVIMREIQDHDAVFGSRYLNGVRVENWSFRRLLLSRFSNELVTRVLRIPSTDTTTAYKCFRREVLEAIDPSTLKGNRNDFMIEIVFETLALGFRTKEIPFMFRERASGESKMEFGVAGASLYMTFKLFFRKLYYRFAPPKSRKTSS